MSLSHGLFLLEQCPEEVEGVGCAAVLEEVDDWVRFHLSNALISNGNGYIDRPGGTLHE